MRKEILRLHLINRIVAAPYIERSAKWAAATKAETDANRRAVMASHDEIYNAIARRDPKAAKEAMERHIEDIIKKALAQIEPKAGTTARELSPEELAYIG